MHASAAYALREGQSRGSRERTPSLSTFAHLQRYDSFGDQGIMGAGDPGRALCHGRSRRPGIAPVVTEESHGTCNWREERGSWKRRPGACDATSAILRVAGSRRRSTPAPQREARNWQLPGLLPGFGFGSCSVTQRVLAVDACDRLAVAMRWAEDLARCP